MTSDAEMGICTTLSSTSSSTLRSMGLAMLRANTSFRPPRNVVVISAGCTSRRLQAESLTWMSSTVCTACSSIAVSADTRSQRSTDSTIAAAL